jgi:hypothetical protein
MNEMSASPSYPGFYKRQFFPFFPQKILKTTAGFKPAISRCKRFFASWAIIYFEQFNEK